MDQLSPVEEGVESGEGEESSDYESDWEAEVTATGQVFHVVPLVDLDLPHTNTNQTREKKKEKKKSSKLSRLVKRREKRENLQQQNQNESSDGDSSTYGQIKTFESLFEGTNPVHLTDVQIRLSVRKGERSDRLLEETLGIVPEERESGEEDSPYSANRLIIAGFLPGSPALKLAADKLRPADWIRSIDGHQVNLENIDSVLRRYTSSCKVKLTVQRAAEISRILGEDDQLMTPPSILKMVTGQGPSPGDVESMLRRLPYLALYMSRQEMTETAADLADVLYQFPTHKQSKLIQVRGLFLTLGHALPEITGSRPVSTSLVVEGDLVHVCYAEEREDLFILALPATKASANEVAQITRDVVRLLRLKYKTLGRAFVQKHWSELNEVFSTVFLEALLDVGEVKAVLDLPTLLANKPARFEGNLAAAQHLPLPQDLKFQVDDALSQLESADFQEFSADFYDSPREFNIIGTCLFHKGYLVTSHLCRDDMVDVVLWGATSQLLPLTRTQPVHQIVAWTEIYPTRRAVSVPHGGGGGSGNSGNPEAEADRTFLLAVGLGFQILAVVLEPGAGTGVAAGDVVRPDPFYVDQALSTLEDLVDMGIPAVCNKWLTLPPNPAILNLDDLLQAGRSRETPTSAAGIILKKTRSYDQTDSPSGSIQESLSFNHSQSDVNSELSEEVGDKTGRETISSHRESNNSSPESAGCESSLWEVYHAPSNASSLPFTAQPEEEEVLHYRVEQLSVSPENTVIHYLHLDVGQGVFIAPTLSTALGPAHTQIIDNFRAAAQIIHSGFEMSMRCAELMQAAEGHSAKPWFNKSLVGVREQSMLFHVRIGKGDSGLFPYWVAGRLFPSPQPRQCYVCYHDSAPQMMIELAYRLAFGVNF